jgi:tRNA pseudouridine38-40 synthase
VNVAALVEYDGTRFAGFQRQSPDKGPTVQGAIETAIGKIIGVVTSIEAAGRTDRGVHATGQVINFVVPDHLDCADWHRALNALLPEDIAVRSTCRVADDFRSRKRAQSRSYLYRILCDSCRAPLRERFAWRQPSRIDTAVMQAGADLLVGKHDFGAFGRSPQNQSRSGYQGHTVRIMLAASCRQAQCESDIVECRFTANAFLTGMVRRLVGTLLLVGLGRLSISEFESILEARDTSHRGPAVPACGLCLTGVDYPPGEVSW